MMAKNSGTPGHDGHRQRLIKHFGSYADVITAEPAALKEVDGIGDATVAVIKTVQAAAQRLAHNHPSGDPKPSKADIEMTKKVAEAGEKLGIQLHDHLIMTRDGHNSFMEMGPL